METAEFAAYSEKIRKYDRIIGKLEGMYEVAKKYNKIETLGEICELGNSHILDMLALGKDIGLRADSGPLLRALDSKAKSIEQIVNAIKDAYLEIEKQKKQESGFCFARTP
jgi:hypothetical protein